MGLIVESYKDRSFEWQCPTCGTRGRILTSADGGLNYRGETPDEVVSQEILTNAIENKYGEEVRKQVIDSIKKAAKMGKNMKIRLYDRYQTNRG